MNRFTVRLFAVADGEAGIPLDQWFGAFRNGRPDGAEANLQEEHEFADKPKAA